MATNLDTSGNYLLLDNEGVKFSIPKKNARVRENANGTIRIFDDSGLLNDIPDSILSGVYTDFADSTGTPFGSLALLLTWLRDNTAFSTGGGNGDGVTEDTLPIGGLVFDKPRFYKINQSTALDIEKAVSGHDSSNTLIPIYLNIIGDEINSITNSIAEIDLAGDALNNTKNNFISLVGLNGNVVSYGNQISELPPIPDITAPVVDSQTLFSDNTYTDVWFNEDTFGTGGGAVLVGQVTIVDYADNLDDASSVTIGSITNTSNTALAGGETVVRVHHTTDVDSNGLATFKIRFTSIEDVLGNSATRTTGDIALNNVSAYDPNDLPWNYINTASKTFNGTSDFQNLGDLTAVLNGANYEIYHKVTITDGQPSANQTLFGINEDNTKGAFNFTILPTGVVRTQHKNSAGTIVNMDTTTAVFTNGSNADKIINVRKTALGFALYINGVLQTLTVSVIAVNSAMTADNVYEGALNNIVGGTVTQYFAGSRKYISVINRALTSPERTDFETYINAL